MSKPILELPQLILEQAMDQVGPWVIRCFRRAFLYLGSVLGLLGLPYAVPRATCAA